MRTGRFKYDAFVSHAVEDKIPVANELCVRLERAGLRIWYSGKELKVGDSLEKTIETGLEQSKYGIVILSQMYLGKNWPRKEYYMLKSKEAERGKVILPVLHDISAEDLQKLDINVADRWAISMDKGVDYVVQKLLEEIRRDDREFQHNKSSGFTAKFKNRFAVGAVALIASFAGYFGYSSYSKIDVPSVDIVRADIQNHILEEDNKIIERHKKTLGELQAIPANMSDIGNVFTNYASLKTNYRNEYELRHDQQVIRSRKRVEAALGFDPGTLGYQNSYNLLSPDVFLAIKKQKDVLSEAKYLLVNKQPVTFMVTNEQRLENGDYEVTVSYDNNIRYLTVTLTFPTEKSSIKRHQVSLMGFFPAEKFVFREESGEWRLSAIE